ncbi:MAG TPA: site-specific integrase [Candidatus Sulfotelmatobacter sp.]|nr:site-specific integrase [Candidatus Sulfotelmatobacter sp.]
MSRKVGQIIARGERRWLVRVYLGRDRETRKRTYHNRTIYGSLRYAQAYLMRRLHERDLSRGVEGLQVTVDELLDHWLETAVQPKVRGKTYSDYAAILRRYIRPAIGARMLASLSPLEIQAAYQIMVNRKLSARTIRYAHAVLRAAIRQAIRWQLLITDPTQGVQLPNPQCREMSVLTTDQARSFLRAAAHSPQRCLFAVALTTGMRPSEYLALCWRDIDWDRGTVSVVRSIHRHEGQWIFTDTKRVRSRRLVRLQTWVLDLLRRMKDETGRAGEACDTAVANLIFTTAHGEPINEEYLVKKHFKPLLREAGLPNIRLYDLRHTSATLALTVGVAPKVVSEQLGHASAAFTLDTYSHVLPHMQEEAAAKMEAALMNGVSL